MRSRGLWIFGSAVSIIAALFAVFIWLEMERVELDERGCPRKGDLEGFTILIIDQSDPFESADKNAVSFLLREWMDEAVPLERLQILAPRFNDPYNPEVVFDRCVPRNPETANQLTTTPSFLKDQWNEFKGGVENAVKVLLEREIAPTSPILETLIAAAREPVFESVGERRIVLISDLYQNSKIISFYAQIPAGWKELRRIVAIDKPDLEGVEVRIRFAARRGGWTAPMKERVKAFWGDFLVASGAYVSWI